MPEDDEVDDLRLRRRRQIAVASRRYPRSKATVSGHDSARPFCGPGSRNLTEDFPATSLLSRPPLRLKPRLPGSSKPEQVFNLRERQDDAVRVSVLQHL